MSVEMVLVLVFCVLGFAVLLATCGFILWKASVNSRKIDEHSDTIGRLITDVVDGIGKMDEHDDQIHQGFNNQRNLAQELNNMNQKLEEIEAAWGRSGHRNN